MAAYVGAIKVRPYAGRLVGQVIERGGPKLSEALGLRLTLGLRLGPPEATLDPTGPHRAGFGQRKWP